MAAVIKKDTKSPEPDEIIAKAILDIDAAMKKLKSGPLRQQVVILLLHDMTKIGRRDIEYILNAMDQLAATYLKPSPK